MVKSSTANAIEYIISNVFDHLVISTKVFKKSLVFFVLVFSCLMKRSSLFVLAFLMLPLDVASPWAQCGGYL